MKFVIQNLVKRLKITGPDLITRPVGRSVFRVIEEKLKQVGEGEVVVLDFENIKVMDLSFIDECIVKTIITSREERAFYTRLSNISDIAEINIDSVFSSYSNFNNDRIVIVTDRICRNRHFFIGELSLEEIDIIEYIRKNKIVKVSDIIDYTGMKSEMVKRVLEELNRLRVVRFKGDIAEAV